MSTDELIGLYRQMLLIRRFEEKAAEMYALGKIAGFCHLYIGQEAVAVGAQAACRGDDYMITAYRDHGHALVRGMPAREVMAELFGKATGCAKGKGGSMHLFDAQRRFMGGYAIVGGHIPIATGIGFALKYQKREEVVLCFFGEGAVPSGAFHESLNIAALWRLPVIYLCENNRFGMGTPVERASALYDIAHAARAYDMPFHHIDGMDVLAVRDSLRTIVEEVRKAKRPIFIEARTYRYMGHSMADPAHGHYRTKEDIDEWKGKDCLANLKKMMVDKKIAAEEDFLKLEREIADEVADAVKFADESPEPPLESLYENVEV